ncbi:hypothetical protein [Thermoleptolyngbya sp.]
MRRSPFISQRRNLSASPFISQSRHLSAIALHLLAPTPFGDRPPTPLGTSNG